MLLATAGCLDAPAQGPVNLFDSAAAPLVRTRPAFDTLWVYGGASDTIMLKADRLAAFPSGDAAVLDHVGQRVHRVGPGGVAWSWGTKGEGPGEVDRVRGLDVNRHGEVVLADSGNGRLQWVSGDGVWLREAGLPAGTINVEDVAALGDGDYILSSLIYLEALASEESAPARLPVTHRWLRLSAQGEVDGLVPIPWDGFHSMSFLQTVGGIAGDRSPAADQSRLWTFGFDLGNGFFVFGDSVANPYPYARHGDFPAVYTRSRTGETSGFQSSYRDERPAHLARDIAMRGDTVFVLAGNHREVDRYDATNGQYLDSVVLPVPLSRFSLASDALVGIVAGSMYPQAIALRAK